MNEMETYSCEACCKRMDKIMEEIRRMCLASKDLMTIYEVMEYTGFSHTFIYEGARDGLIPCCFVGNGQKRKTMVFEREKIYQFFTQNPNGWQPNIMFEEDGTDTAAADSGNEQIPSMQDSWA